MDESILNNTKKALGVSPEYTPFDVDIIMHINAALSVLSQIGIGPIGGLSIEDDTAEWSLLVVPPDQIGMIKSYVYLKTKLLFDPPTTSFLLTAMKEQVEEFETRLHYAREALIPVPVPDPVEEEPIW